MADLPLLGIGALPRSNEQVECKIVDPSCQ
jgi:hypothetical protein